MINPQSIDFAALPWVPLDSTAGFPAKPGIYFAIDSQSNIQYIGRSGDVRGRWKNHHRYDDLDAIGGVRIAYLFVDAVELLPDIETALIQWFDPPLNIVRTPRSFGEVATSKKKISAYLDESLKDKAEALAEGRGMSLSTLVAYLLSREVRQAEQSGEIKSND